MSHATNPRALWIGAACLLAVLALLATRAPWVAADPAQGDSVSAGEEAQCGGSSPEAMDAAVADVMEQLRQAPGADARSDVVVLNNRGYNYGPPPGVRIDSHLFGHEGAGSEPR